MMFNNRFVACIRVNGKILRENQNLISLPFGAEYEILLKNLHSRRAMVTVSVDGQDATGGTRLIIQPNSSITLERFIRNGNLSSGNKLKFIERTAGVEAFRGIGSDDGLVRCEFWAEQETPISVTPYWPYVGNSYTSSSPGHSVGGFRSFDSTDSAEQERGGFQYGRAQGAGNAPGVQTTLTSNVCSTTTARSINDAGITVAGSESHQQFYNASGFPLEANSHVIVLQLRGAVAGVPVAAPVTVQYRPTCGTCGRVNKATNKFCSDCGTALFLI